jgi:nicotinamidase-related amidase
VKQALLVIDVQQALFVSAEPKPFEADEVIQRINALLARARAAGVPVVWVQHEREGSLLVHGSPGWQLADGLHVQADDRFVRKTTPDSFLRTGLQAVLDGLGVRQLVIAGYASEFCVDTTTRRAAALGYGVTLASDAHTTLDKPHASGALIRAHENATLPHLTSFGARIRALPADRVQFKRAAAA